jgi:hypothetical protein
MAKGSAAATKRSAKKSETSARPRRVPDLKPGK